MWSPVKFVQSQHQIYKTPVTRISRGVAVICAGSRVPPSLRKRAFRADFLRFPVNLFFMCLP